MNALPFVILAASALSAQLAIPRPLGVGVDKLYESTTEYKAQHPNCFLPIENLPTNYKVWRYMDHGENRFECRVTSVENDQLHLLGFNVMTKQTVIAKGHVAAIFYDLPRKDIAAIESTLRERLGGPTEGNVDGYIGRDGCRGREIHWRNEVSEIVLIDECENDKYGVTAINLFYTRHP